jgi:7-cyano-7-deazaguanine synthase
MKLENLVDKRLENSAVVLADGITKIKHNKPVYLFLESTNISPENSQHFDISKVTSQFEKDSWAYKLFKVCCAVARAESLGSTEVYIPQSYFHSLVEDGFYNALEVFVNEGTNKNTNLKILTYNNGCTDIELPRLNLNQNSSINLMSGGTDSVVAAALQKASGRELHLLQVIYQQAARYQEQWCVNKVNEDMQADSFTKIEMDILKKFGGSALLRDDMQLNEKNLTLEYVPFRNSLFLSIGLMLANKIKAGKVILGAHPDDSMAPDGTREYVRAFNDMLNLFKFKTQSIEAPLLYYGGKPELIKLGLDLGVNFGHTWSCHTYLPKENVGSNAEPCGTCGNCKTRYSSFKKLNIKDPLNYKTQPLIRTQWAGKKENFEKINELYLPNNK